MKNFRALIMVAVSLLIGLGAVVVATRWLTQQASVATDQVVVAARDLDLGTRLTPDMLKLAQWPRGSQPKGAVTDLKLLDGRVVNVSLLRGEPVLENKLAPVGAKGGLSAVIPEGKRAITVKVNEVVGVAGFALPGNHVDILVNTQDEKSQPVSKIVLEQILVLAVAQEVGRDETKPKVVNAVTLEVTPEQAERLDLARSVGTLSLVLRNQVDKQAAATGGMRKSDLLASPSVVPPQLASKAAPQAPARTQKPAAPAREKSGRAERSRVEVIRGTQSSEVSF